MTLAGPARRLTVLIGGDDTVRVNANVAVGLLCGLGAVGLGWTVGSALP